MTPLAVVVALVAGGSSMASYAAAAAGHHKRADLFVTQGNLGAAASEMVSLLALRAPGDARAEDLVLDAHGRLAEIHLKAGKPEEARNAALEGIARARRTSAFVARLYVVLGDARAAMDRHDEALEAYQRAIDVNRALIDAARDGGGGGR